mmetsp:Transcript_37059/g.83904  ORF Transcript_37059/g.83904 Transcript_37059/m.83904 type:complete len:117 (+) Transcript_37059:1940-2290(+)
MVGNDGGGIHLATCVLMSPDACQKTFLERDFELLRQMCSRITMYGDERDWALFFSEVFTRERSLGKHPFELVRRANSRDVSSPVLTSSMNEAISMTNSPSGVVCKPRSFVRTALRR